MSKNDVLFEEIDKLKQHQTLEDFFSHFQSFITAKGFDQYIYSAVPSFINFPTDDFDPVLYTTYPPAFLECYFEERLYLNDSSLRHGLSGSDEIYVLPLDDETLRHLPQTDRRVYLIARDMGFESALMLPIHNVFGVIGLTGLSYKGPTKELRLLLSEQQRDTELFAYAFNEAILEKQFDHFSTPNFSDLSPKEAEALKWIAAGYTYELAASKMNIGISTVRKHFSNVIKKLNARNGQHACALAVKWRIVA